MERTEKRKLWATDMDGTLICNQPVNKYGICVAVKGGKNSSFMKNETYDKLMKLINCEDINILPITSRCRTSYLNIYFNKFFDRALVENGAILVSNNKQEEIEWITESREIIKEVKSKFDLAKSIIESYGYKAKWSENEFTIDHTVETELPEKVRAQFETELNQFRDDFVVNIGAKSILMTYKCLSKGENIKRFANKFDFELFLSSGDNLEDESMYKETLKSISKTDCADATYTFKSRKEELEKSGLEVTKHDYIDYVVEKVYEIYGF